MDETPIYATLDFPSKRKYGKIGSYGPENCKAMSKEVQSDADADYKRFLNGYMMSICKSLNDDSLGNDPQYEMFLSCLKEDGNKCWLEVTKKNGLSKPLKYDAEDGSDDELDQETQRGKRNMIGGIIHRSNSSTGSKLEDPKTSSLSENQRKESVIENDARSESINPNPFGHQEYLVGELDTASTYVSNIQCKIGMRSGSSKEYKSKIWRKSRKVAEDGLSGTAVNVEKQKDDEYQIVCNNVSYEGNNLVFKYKDNPPIVYEADDKLQNFQTYNSTYSMKANAKLLAHAGGSDASVEGDDSCHYLGSRSRERHSRFREQLMKILRKPYDIEEHQMLELDIVARKPIERHIDLRHGREQCYSFNKDGKSYLDHYYDLKQKFLAAEDSRKALNLLRGFFFWIQARSCCLVLHSFHMSCIL